MRNRKTFAATEQGLAPMNFPIYTMDISVFFLPLTSAYVEPILFLCFALLAASFLVLFHLKIVRHIYFEPCYCFWLMVLSGIGERTI